MLQVRSKWCYASISLMVDVVFLTTMHRVGVHCALSESHKSWQIKGPEGA